MLTLTDLAAQKVHDFLESQGNGAQQAGLRVGIKGGGCSGFTYTLSLDEQHEDDQIFETNEVKILVDSDSLQYVDGSVVDYVETFQGSGFQVNNPNVVAACGCGSSFRVAEEEPSCGASA